MVAQGRRRRRWVVRRVPPARRGGGGRRERVPAGCVVPAPVPVEELPPIRRRRRHPRRRCGRRPSGAYPQLRRAPQITYARPSRLRSVAGLLSRSNLQRDARTNQVKKVSWSETAGGQADSEDDDLQSPAEAALGRSRESQGVGPRRRSATRRLRERGGEGEKAVEGRPPVWRRRREMRTVAEARHPQPDEEGGGGGRAGRLGGV